MNHRSRSPGLDFLRALAVLMVLVFHFSNDSKGLLFSPFAKYGWMGVDLFFVLSGFLISAQVLRPVARGEGIDYRKFYLRRVFRTLPNYLVVLVIYLFYREHPVISPIWKYLSFTQNIGLNRAKTGAFTHAWSLCVEEQFYLVLPFAICFFQRPSQKNKVVTSLFVLFISGMLLRGAFWVGILARAQTHSIHFSSLYARLNYYFTLTHLDALLVGVSLALVMIYRPETWQAWLSKAEWLTGIAITFLIGGAILNEYKYSLWGSIFLFSFVALGFGALLVLFLSPRFWFAHRRVPGIETLAILSYAIYLLQKLIFYWCENNLPRWGIEAFSYSGALITFGLCLVAASILYWTVEKPMMTLRQKLILK